ncbi:MAG: hypothetical protein ACYTF0_09455, partial [Planctomycetota bacterium]
LTAWADCLAIPAIIGLPCGHDADPLSLVYGANSSLQVSTNGDWQLVLDEDSAINRRCPAPR